MEPWWKIADLGTVNFEVTLLQQTKGYSHEPLHQTCSTGVLILMHHPANPNTLDPDKRIPLSAHKKQTGIDCEHCVMHTFFFP